MPSLTYLSTLLLLPAAITAVSLDCKHIRADDESFNFEALGGPKAVNWQRHTPPSITNTTFTIDICKPLTRSKDKNERKEQCAGGTRVCGTQRVYQNGVNVVQEVVPIAGEYTHSEGRAMDPAFKRLKYGEGHEESKKEGVRGELHGGMWNKQKQKAVIEFLCDTEWEGTEGFEDDKSKMLDVMSYGSMSRREEPEDDDSDGDDGEDDSPLPDLDEGKALQFVSYETEKDDVGVLRLTWKTKHACEGAADQKPTPGQTGASWGFFTWFIIIVFLAAASYIIFGSWLNYNRYGARGWDLIPHGDTIRDLPYIAKDLAGGVMDKLKGSGGSRGGYSAV